MVIPTKVVALGQNKAQIPVIHPEQPGRGLGDGWLRNTAGKMTWMPHPSFHAGLELGARRMGRGGNSWERTAPARTWLRARGLLSQQHSCRAPPPIPTWDTGQDTSPPSLVCRESGECSRHSTRHHQQICACFSLAERVFQASTSKRINLL